jgi:Icc-related predicted phosphoesterase
MIFVVGDIHGEFGAFWDAVDDKIAQVGEKPSLIIQVGDFGYFSPGISQWKNDLAIPVMFIDGNHEDFDLLDMIIPTQLLFHIPRGTVCEFEGKRIAFCGGGESIDRAYRKEGISWWRDERVRRSDIEKVIENVDGKPIDYLITHCPPVSIIHSHFPKLDHEDWGLPADWKDESGIMIQELWDRLGNPNLICGHMHKSVHGPNYEMLDCHEVRVL